MWYIDKPQNTVKQQRVYWKTIGFVLMQMLCDDLIRLLFALSQSTRGMS